MSETIATIVQFMKDYPQLAGLITFIISAGESVAVIGTIVPGSVMMTAIGAFVGTGTIPFWSTLIWAILGAIVGDGISYWIGHHFKSRLHNVWPFRTHPYLLANGEKFFKHYGGMSVFIGRFVGPVRALVPLVAGMLGMSPLRFIIANITSAILWAPIYMLPGFLFGKAAIELSPDIAVHTFLMLLLVCLFIILCGWLIQKTFKLIGNQVNHFLTWFWEKLQTSRCFSVITTVLKHYDTRKTHGQLTLAFYFIVAIVLLTYLAITVMMRGPQAIIINNICFHLFRSFRTPTGDDIMLAITFLGEVKVIFPVMLALFGWFAWTKRWHTAWHILALGILTFGGIEVMKHIVHSPRPVGVALNYKGFSFPSGHTTFATVFYIGLSLILVKASRIRHKAILYTLAGLVILAISVSRLYLSAHWFTDILGGWLLGSAILMLITLSYHRKSEHTLKPTGILLTALITFAITYSVAIHRNFDIAKQNSTQVDWPTHTITFENWWNRKGDHIPLFRVNRFGFTTQLLNLQWLDNLEAIKAVLLTQGWQVPPERDWVSVLKRISDVQSSEHLPLVSPLYLDKDPVLVLIKSISGNKKLIVLRLWQSNIIISDVHKPLWVGNIESVPTTYGWLFKRKKYHITNPIAVLFTTLPSQYVIKTVTIQTSRNKHHYLYPIIMIKSKS